MVGRLAIYRYSVNLLTVTDSIPKQWLYGFLEMCLLCLLHERRDYGLGLMERLRAVGFGEVAGGTLYPALLRMEKTGFVRTEQEVSVSGPPRKYYLLTECGGEAMRARQAAWLVFRGAVDTVVEPGRYQPSGERTLP